MVFIASRGQPKSDEVVEFGETHGILDLVTGWEEALASMKSGWQGAAEYDFDLFSRTRLHEIMALDTPEDVAVYVDRIAPPDAASLEMTKPAKTPVHHIDHPDPAIHWWLYRWPIH